MSHRKKINDVGEDVSVQFQNKFAQIIALAGARKSYIYLGRGSAKTTDVQCERLIDLIQEMPGAPVAWVADTFTNLTSNILPSLLEGLERKGFIEGVHYVVESEPPTFTYKETTNLPAWLRKHFWKPFNKLVSYKRTIIFYTGLNIRFGSLDRPSSLAGASYVFVFGDEVKYFKPEKIANLLKANRGYYAEYGHSIYYRGVMFTSDLADPSHVGEYDWMQNEAQNMNINATLQVLQAGLVYNEALHEFVAAKEKYLKTKSSIDLVDARKKQKTANRWRARWMITRKRKEADTFYICASSYVNADILTADWFADALASGLPDTRTAILSLHPILDSGERFYAGLREKHFYFDGINEEAYDKLGMRANPDCRILKYLNLSKPITAGVDFGNMCSMSVAQESKVDGTDTIRVLRFLYTLAPEFILDLGRKFRIYFAPMKVKVLFLYYDRAGNSYKRVNKDQISELKKSIEYDEKGLRTGWVVHLMSQGQDTIYQSEEYHFMQVLMNETNPRLPVLKIDAFACKELKSSLEKARTKVKDGIIHKDKSSEKLPISDLPMKSTNPSDSFKYLLMTKELRKIVKNRTGGAVVASGVTSSKR